MNATIVSNETYIQSVRIRSRIEPGFWTGRCANWRECGQETTSFVVADEYYESANEAARDGVEWGMRVCVSCKRRYYSEAKIIAMRQRVILKKRRECVSVDFRSRKECGRHATHFIVLVFENGEMHRRYMCVNCIAIHSEYTEIYRIRQNGEIEDVTWDLNAFYLAHIRPTIVD